MADWTQVFSGILDSHLKAFVEAKGDALLHTTIVKNCRNEILATLQANNSSIILPDHMRLAIQKVFLDVLDTEDQEDEAALIQQVEDQQEQLQSTTEEREAAAHPTTAGEFVNPWTPFRAAQRLFKDEFDTFNKKNRNSSDKQSLGKRTQNVNVWFDALSNQKNVEAENAVKKWNDMGAGKEQQAIKNLKAQTNQFLNSSRGTMGVNIMMLVAYEKGDNVVVTCQETVTPGFDKLFSVSSKEVKEWMQPVGIFWPHTYSLRKDEGIPAVKVPEVWVDRSGNPRLPDWSGLKLKDQQLLVREIFTKAYIKFAKKSNATVPWGLLARLPESFLHAGCYPEDFPFNDPLKMTKAEVTKLWRHWSTLNNSGLPILEFIKGKPEDMPLAKDNGGHKRKRTKVAYVEKIATAGKSKPAPAAGLTYLTSGGMGPGISKPKSAVQPPAAESDSPAAQTNRWSFITSLSINKHFVALTTILAGLPKSGPPSSAKKSPIPKWAAWSWGFGYLPEDIHS
ncbi:hypothetical protein PAXRUDRAFT_16281 [Paxillus rubicundulus Ve08.2h10]|uniref:Uncharacterized protein n=1 Tax=Paxillus rubicundulus Ve08.2h10 TaxID=930991 RepID=A0A0D0DEZ6_9AGAM|nr:hypothetical protein PAXRUDRAFT_16281 [Paxillus rubicundulus Ve08.2h10]